MTNLRKTILTAMAVFTVALSGIAAIPSNAEAGFFDGIGGSNRFATSTGTARSTVTFARPATQTQVGTVPSTIQFGNPATQTQFGTVPSTIIFGQ